MLGLARVITGGSPVVMGNKMPLGEMHRLGNLPEAANIKNLATLPGSGSWNQTLALKATQQAEMAKQRVAMGKQIAAGRKSEIDSAVQMTGIRLDVKAHGMKAAAKITDQYANFRGDTLSSHHQMLTGQARVSGMEKAMNESQGLIAL